MADDGVGDQFEGMRNRLSFLRAPSAQSQRSPGKSMGRPDSQDDLPETPFDVAFLTFFFLQIYVGQLIIQSVVLFWSFSLDSPHEPTALLCLDLFAIALLVGRPAPPPSSLSQALPRCVDVPDSVGELAEHN